MCRTYGSKWPTEKIGQLAAVIARMLVLYYRRTAGPLRNQFS